ncbi:MAG: hypothetical protein ACPGEF_05075 [Endozoicomonas sp.]
MLSDRLSHSSNTNNISIRATEQLTSNNTSIKSKFHHRFTKLIDSIKIQRVFTGIFHKQQSTTVEIKLSTRGVEKETSVIEQTEDHLSQKGSKKQRNEKKIKTLSVAKEKIQAQEEKIKQLEKENIQLTNKIKQITGKIEQITGKIKQMNTNQRERSTEQINPTIQANLSIIAEEPEEIIQASAQN